MPHLGRVYPYAHDLWAVSSQFWPAFIPRKLRIAFAGSNPYPWGDCSDLVDVSAIVSLSVDREFALYEFVPPVGYTRLFVVVGVATAPVKATSYNLVLIGGPLPSIAGASNVLPAPQYFFGNGDWPSGPPVLPNIVYVPPDCSVRAATWAEV